MVLTYRQLHWRGWNNGFLDVLKIINPNIINWTEWSTVFYDNKVKTKIFVVEEDIDECKKIIGTTTLILCRKFGGILGLIEDVAVLPEYENKEIGSQLIRYVLGQAQNLGCYKVILTCKDKNVQFYQKNKMELYQNCMCIKFNNDGDKNKGKTDSKS